MHALHVPHMKGGPNHPYLDESALDHTWKSWSKALFDGKHITRRTDRDNVGRNPAGATKLLVKDVFACGAFASLAPVDVSLALVMRHPVAVALSKRAHRHWHWTWNVREFVEHPRWSLDHLGPWRETLERVAHQGGEMENLVAVWAVLNATALREASQERLPIVHYERAVLDPWTAVLELKNKGGWASLVTASEQEVLREAGRISFVSKSADKATLPDPARWMKQVTPSDRRKAESVLQSLGLDVWHDTRGMPSEKGIQAWREAQRPPRA